MFSYINERLTSQLCKCIFAVSHSNVSTTVRFL